MGIEDHIIKGCINKQRDCQKKLYDVLAGKMMFVCFRYCKNRDDAEDILQEGFIKVFKHIDTFKFEGSFDDIENVSNHPESESDAVSQMNEKDLLKLLCLLPDGYRTVFNLFAIEGYSHKEIAVMLKISEGTSKSQLSKAKAQLKNLLHQYFDVDIKVKNYES